MLASEYSRGTVQEAARRGRCGRGGGGLEPIFPRNIRFLSGLE